MCRLETRVLTAERRKFLEFPMNFLEIPKVFLVIPRNVLEIPRNDLEFPMILFRISLQKGFRKQGPCKALQYLHSH